MFRRRAFIYVSILASLYHAHVPASPEARALYFSAVDFMKMSLCRLGFRPTGPGHAASLPGLTGLITLLIRPSRERFELPCNVTLSSYMQIDRALREPMAKSFEGFS